jgi:hypothetical protein
MPYLPDDGRGCRCGWCKRALHPGTFIANEGKGGHHVGREKSKDDKDREMNEVGTITDSYKKNNSIEEELAPIIEKIRKSKPPVSYDEKMYNTILTAYNKIKEMDAIRETKSPEKLIGVRMFVNDEDREKVNQALRKHGLYLNSHDTIVKREKK